MKRIGLTGSIAAGKSTAAEILRGMGLPVFDADAAVHELYADPSFARRIGEHFPGTLSAGGVDRARLARLIADDPARLTTLENLVHPAVKRRHDQFLEVRRAQGAAIAILDVPLLFETGAERELDAVILIVADDALRRARAFQRPGMTEEKWRAISARQWPQEKKQALATIVIDNSGTRDALRQALAVAIDKLGAGNHA